MTKAACKEEENSNLAAAMDVLGRRCALFESYMRQGLLRDREIQAGRDIDGPVTRAVELASEQYAKLNRAVAVRD